MNGAFADTPALIVTTAVASRVPSHTGPTPPKKIQQKMIWRWILQSIRYLAARSECELRPRPAVNVHVLDALNLALIHSSPLPKCSLNPTTVFAPSQDETPVAKCLNSGFASTVFVPFEHVPCQFTCLEDVTRLARCLLPGRVEPDSEPTARKPRWDCLPLVLRLYP